MKRILLIPTLLLLLLGAACYLISTGFSRGAWSGIKADDANRPIVFCSADDLKTLDIGKMSWANDLRTAMALWEGLAAYDPKTLQPIPGVAKSWDISPDGKTYTFHLRDDARWSNADPVTANDFLFAWKRVLTPATGADYLNLFDPIEGTKEYTQALTDGKPVDAIKLGFSSPDPHTLIVQLRAPCTYFLDLIAFPTFYPLHEASMRPFLLDKKDPAKGYDLAWTRPPHLVTNGAFQLVEWRFKQFLRLVPNLQYWDRKNVQCEELLLTSINDERAALVAYQSGTVDAMSFVPQAFGEDLLAAQRNGQWSDMHYRPVFGSYYYVFNCARAPFNDKRIRKALALAVDRQEIVDKVTRMNQRPLGLLVPPDSIPGYQSPPEMQMNIAEAKRLLAEAGFPDGQGMRTIEILFNTEAAVHGKVAQAIGQMWQRNLGVRVSYRALERGSFGAARQVDHDFDIARGGWYGDYTDPTTWLDLIRTDGGNNDGKFSNKAYDDLLNKAAAEPDPARRFTLLRDAEQMLIEDEVPFIPLYQYGDGFIYDEKKIAGIDVNVRLLTQLKWIHRLNNAGK